MGRTRSTRGWNKIVVETEGKVTRTTTVWQNKSYDAGQYGTSVLGNIIGSGKFTFPKSVYAVMDTLKYFIANKKNALVVDFFAGSGTTMHAVNLLNSIDNGHRRCIMVTNNEVSADEAKALDEKDIGQEIRSGIDAVLLGMSHGLERFVPLRDAILMANLSMGTMDVM